MFVELLRRRMAGIVDLSTSAAQALEAHYNLLVRWNKTLNLTRIDDLETAVERHYCESLFLAAHLPPGALTLVDVGSGAGFPGIPVAVLRLDCMVTLVEAHQRKAVFLKESTRMMKNVQVLAQRAESVDRQFDVTSSRAVSYKDIGLVVQKMARTVALLTGIEPPPADWGFAWEAALLMPWGTKGICGGVTAYDLVVSRETQGVVPKL